MQLLNRNLQRAFCIVLLFVSTTASPPIADAGEVEWDEHLRAATKARDVRNYTSAIEFFLGAVEEARKFVEQDPQLAKMLSAAGYK